MCTCIWCSFIDNHSYITRETFCNKGLREQHIDKGKLNKCIVKVKICLQSYTNRLTNGSVSKNNIFFACKTLFLMSMSSINDVLGWRNQRTKQMVGKNTLSFCFRVYYLTSVGNVCDRLQKNKINKIYCINVPYLLVD